MKNDMLRELQEYYYGLKDTKGHWRKEPIGSLYRYRTSDKNLETIRKILTVILDSDFISMETKVYISSKGITIKEVNQFIDDARAVKLSHGGLIKPLNYNTTCHRLSQDNNDLETYLGNGVLRGIAKNDIEDEKATNKRLVKFKERYGLVEKYRDNLEIEIKSNKPEVNGYMNNEEFFEILGSLEAYLTQRKEIITQAVNSNKEFTSYFNYLLSKQAIDNDSVKRDRERLIRFLKNEDYTTEYETEESEEQVFDDNRRLKHLEPDDIKVSDKGLELNNYTAIDYDEED